VLNRTTSVWYYDAETGLNQNYFRDYDPLVGRYVESDPLGQRSYFDFLRFTGQKTHAGYWNHLYNYAGASPVMATDRRGLLPDWLDWFADFFREEAPKEPLSKTVGAGLSAICIARNCGKARDITALTGDCMSYLNDWAKGHPEIMATLGGITGDGAAAATSACAELCAKGIKTGSCDCPKGPQ